MNFPTQAKTGLEWATCVNFLTQAKTGLEWATRLRQMKLQPYHLESVVIDPRSVGDNNLSDDAWCKAEFEEDEEDDSDEEGEGEDEEDTDAEGGEEDSSADEQEDDEPAPLSKKPVQAVRAAGAVRAEGACPERSERASRPTKPHSSQNRA